MELITISQVSKDYKVSTRTLRYYEQIGLLRSTKKEGYAYRVYNEEAICRLQQIIILRKLSIPLKHIAHILGDKEILTAIKVLKENISILKDKINGLSAIKDILKSLVKELEKKQHVEVRFNLLDHYVIQEVVDSLSLENYHFKEENEVEDLKNAVNNLNKLNNVRVVKLPPFTIAANHYIGENPEEHAGEQLEQFLKQSKLYERKPDARVFGFNHPNPSEHKSHYGYEVWVTIPDDMEVPKPFVKKQFEGGLYAAHMITLGNFHEWEWLSNWVNSDNPLYEANLADDNGEIMGGALEEHLNYAYYSSLNWPESDAHQLDLLFPIKLKK